MHILLLVEKIIVCENTQYWIETKEGYAFRQIVVENDEKIEISCRMDCLSEGVISIEELAGEIKEINFEIFEEKWNSVCESYKNEWNNDKNKYLIGMPVEGIVKYFFPQGVIVQIGKSLGVCDLQQLEKVNKGNTISNGMIISGTVEGYNETNMWVKIAALPVE